MTYYTGLPGSGRFHASVLRYQTTGTSPLSASSVHLLLIFGSTGSMVPFLKLCFECSRLMGRAGTRMIWLRDSTRGEDFYIGGRLARLSGPPGDKYCKRTRFSIAAAADETPPNHNRIHSRVLVLSSESKSVIPSSGDSRGGVSFLSVRLWCLRENI